MFQPIITNIKVPFKHYDCILEISAYVVDESVALMLMDSTTHEPIATCTSYVENPSVPLLYNEVWIKDYSENEGMYKALTNSGVINYTNKKTVAGFATMRAGEFTKKVMAIIGEHKEN